LERVPYLSGAGENFVKALVYLGAHRMSYRDEPQPTPAEGEAVVKIEAVGICGSDLHAYHGHDARRTDPIIMGHEASGRVVSGEMNGRRVVLNPLIACGRCKPCEAGQDHLCTSRQQISVHRPGAFAEFIAMPVGNLIEIPGNLDWVSAALAEPTAVCIHGVGRAERATDLARSHALIIGGGAIGLLTALILRQRNCKSVSLAETNSLRRQTAAQAGIEDVFDPAASPPRKFDLIADAVGIAATRRFAIDSLSPGGTLLHLGLGEGDGGIDFVHMTRNEISILGSARSSRADMVQGIELIQSGALGAMNWIEQRPLSAGEAAFADIDRGKSAAAKIILRPSPAP
jgi:alcohol dehydrogenase